MQLNKLQIKAEILAVISKLQTNLEAADVDAVLKTLTQQEDKKVILDVLVKELLKANEQKTVLICFLLIKLCDVKEVESSLWEVLKSPSASDATKAIVLNVLKDMGNKVDYEKLEEYFDNPEDVIDADTQKLLSVAIVNPEAQIDFLDFLQSLSDVDKNILIKSLGEDYTSDNLANILNPLFLYEPETEIGHCAIGIIGETKSQLALHALLEGLEFVQDEDTITLIKKNISKLKIAGVRQDNAIEFYKSVLPSKPYVSYTSYPDGHGNQAIIFARERETETIQFVAIVINDSWGIVDCFGFNEISKPELERIVERFYNGEEQVYISPHFAKTLLVNAEKLSRKQGSKSSYEYICWKTLLSDIEQEVVPVELILKSEYQHAHLTDDQLDQIYEFDFVQRWFFDPEYNDAFKELVEKLNSSVAANNLDFEFEEVVANNLDLIFDSEQKNLLDKRILMCAYLRHLAGKKDDAKLLYSLYFDEAKKLELAKNIIRKSIYEYYISLKFRLAEIKKTTNIFALKGNKDALGLNPKQVELVISILDSLWVKG